MESTKLQTSFAFIKRHKYIVAAILLFLLAFSSFLSNQSSIQPTSIPTPLYESPTTIPQNNRPLERKPTEGRSGPPLQSAVQESRAISAVENVKEVQDFKQSVTTAGNTRLVTEVDSYPTAQDASYLIHVYEVVPNGDGSAHSATFGWYRFYPQTGTVQKQ